MNILAGYPGETAQNCIESAYFIIENRNIANFTPPGIVLVRPNSPLHDAPQKHGIDKIVDGKRWYTIDRQNTYEVRLVRQFVLNQAVYNKSLTIDDLAYEDKLKFIDFNSAVVKKEIKNLAYFLSMAAGFSPLQDSCYINLCAEDDFSKSKFKIQFYYSFLFWLQNCREIIQKTQK